MAETLERFGRIDVLVNNAGRTQVGAVEETTDEELRSLFELHFFAPVALTRLVLPHMRRQGGGVIVQMSSVGGQTTAPGFGAYCATKFALEGLTETLRDEVAAFGIRTLIVEPGAFRTGLFRPGAAYESEPMSEYADTVGPTRAYVRDNDGLQPGDPAKAAQAILAALGADQAPLRLVLGADAIGNIERRLEGVADELAAWRAVGEATAVGEPWSSSPAPQAMLALRLSARWRTQASECGPWSATRTRDAASGGRGGGRRPERALDIDTPPRASNRGLPPQRL